MPELPQRRLILFYGRNSRVDRLVIGDCVIASELQQVRDGEGEGAIADTRGARTQAGRQCAPQSLHSVECLRLRHVTR